MLNFISTKLSQLKDDSLDFNLPSSTLQSLDLDGPPGIIPLGRQKRIVLTGFITEDATLLHGSQQHLPCVSITSLQTWLNETHGPGTEYIVWNLSGTSYNYSKLRNNVMEYKLLGKQPCPPFSVLCELAYTIHAWTTGLSSQVAIIHADVGGLTAALVAACVLYLEVIRSLGVHDDAELQRDSLEAWKMERVAFAVRSSWDVVVRKMDVYGIELLPSHKRYFDYIVKTPKGRLNNASRTLALHRIVVNEIPDFGTHHSRRVVQPVAKVYQGDVLIACSEIPRKGSNLIDESDGSFVVVLHSKHINDGTCVLQGDSLFRIYHTVWDDDETPMLLPMFSFMVNTRFIEGNVIRFTAHELDGAVNNGRFPPGFFIDVVLVPATVAQTEEHKIAVPVHKISRYSALRNVTANVEVEDVGKDSHDQKSNNVTSVPITANLEPNCDFTSASCCEAAPKCDKVPSTNSRELCESQTHSTKVIPSENLEKLHPDSNAADYLNEIDRILQSDTGEIDWNTAVTMTENELEELENELLHVEDASLL